MNNEDLQDIINDERDNPIGDVVIEKVRKSLEGRSLTKRGVIRATHLKNPTVTKVLATLVSEKKARSVMIANKTGPSTILYALIDPEEERQKDERARQYRLKVALGL